MAHLLKTSFVAASSPSLRRRPFLRPPFHTTRRPLQVQAEIREFFMPALSATMTEGKIVSWIKTEGDKIAMGESIVVVECDKADMNVETFCDGYLAAIIVDEGGVAPVGSSIALLAETEDEISEAQSRAANSSASPASEPPPEKSPDNAGAAVAKPAPVLVASTHPASEGGKRFMASPYAKKLAKDWMLKLRVLLLVAWFRLRPPHPWSWEPLFRLPQCKGQRVRTWLRVSRCPLSEWGIPLQQMLLMLFTKRLNQRE
ncbi:unnamed protein product [Citrullus colocynthis]|uniref:Lipoyl-binding domain-containing protein n=1 Tax=Citrullus colocynthis TaxID=252529 RepID=A0ABP0XPI6_9ROSI